MLVDLNIRCYEYNILSYLYKINQSTYVVYYKDIVTDINLTGSWWEGNDFNECTI